MEPRDFAQEVRFATSREANIQCPEVITYDQSGARTPSVFVFNPFAEGRIAHGKSFSPTKHQAMLASDLANLPQFLCREDDIVLLAKRPSVEFLTGIKQAGFSLPEFVELNEPATRSLDIQPPSDLSGRPAPKGASGQARGIRGLASRKIGTLRPWAWGPDSVELLEPLMANVTGETRTKSQRFNSGLAQLYSKAWSAALLRRRLACDSLNKAEGWLCTEQEVGVAVNTLQGAFAAIDAIRARGHHKVVVKEALGLAGQNSIRLWEPGLLEPQRRWMANALQKGRELVVEPWLERLLDFSVQLEMGTHGLKLCGYTGLVNDKRGQFEANWAESDHHRRVPARVVALFRKPADIANRLQRLYADIFSLLEGELRHAGHVGPVGLDAFVYRTPEGDCRLKPIVEINPRYTMGRLTVELMKQTCPESCGLFRLVSRAMAQAEGFEDFSAYARSLGERFPLCLEGEPVPKIREGSLCLNDPAQAQVCLAVFQVHLTSEALGIA